MEHRNTGAQSKDDSKNGAIDVIASLFSIVLSGTHAPLDLRLKVVKALLGSAEPRVREIGARALQALLKTDGFSHSHSFEFGARSRDYGYHPKTRHDGRAWFSTVLRFVEPLALSDNTDGQLVRTAIAHEFRGLWTDSGQVDRLEQLSRAIRAKQFWREGWISARQTRMYDSKRLSADILARLSALEELLRPKDLFDRVRGLVLGSRDGRFDVDDSDGAEDERDYVAAAARATATAEQLGRDLALDQRMFDTLLPELLAGGGKVEDFGRGLALGAEEPTCLWNLIVERLATANVTRVDLLCGFLEGLQVSGVSLVHTVLDRALDDPTLCSMVSGSASERRYRRKGAA